MHAYGLNYLSPYKTHSSIFAWVGHRILQTYFYRFLPSSTIIRTDYVTLHIRIPFFHLDADGRLTVLGFGWVLSACLF